MEHERNHRRLVKHRLSATCPGDRRTIGGQLSWQRKTYDQGGSARRRRGSYPYRVEQPAFTVVDMVARYRTTEDVALLLNVGNVFDQTS